MATKHLKGDCQHCGGPLQFPAEHTGLVADCPHCRQPTELLLARPPEEPTLPTRAIVWAVVALLILGLGLGALLVGLNMAEHKAAKLKQNPSVRTQAVDSIH